jgi:preprotein translocase SecE subunit
MATKQDKKPKRQLKNPETFKERSLKAVESNQKPRTHKKIFSLGRTIIKPVTSPVAKFFKQLVTIQPFKAIFTILSWLGLVLLPKYIRTSWVELKQVTWPSLAKSRQLTSAVLIFALIFGASVAVVDYGLDKLFKHILLK